MNNRPGMVFVSRTTSNVRRRWL